MSDFTISGLNQRIADCSYLYQKFGYRVFRTEKITDNLEFIYLEKTSATAYNAA